MQSQRLTIKYGGNAIADRHSIDKFSQAICALKQTNKAIIICHGGGPQINYWLEKTQTESHFINGQRFTDQKALDIVEMTLAAHVNKAIVRALQALGVNAIGLSGEDAGLLVASQNQRLGFVGNVTESNPHILNLLLKENYVPVIAPLACDAQYQTALNINADYAAAHIAGASQSEQCIFMTNVDGILDENQQKINHANQSLICHLIDNGTISGGMIPKTDCALTALKLGVQSTRIINGTDPENLLKLSSQSTIGTIIDP